MPRISPTQAPLNERQRRFVEAYLECGNGAEAARRAGYSPASANSRAAKLMRHPAVRAAIDSVRERKADLVSNEEVIGRLRRESDREGKNSSHAGRVSAIRALGEIAGVIGKGRDDGPKTRVGTINITFVGDDSTRRAMSAAELVRMREVEVEAVDSGHTER